MRSLRTMLLLLLAILVQGCLVASLHPFYREGDITFDSALLGTWTFDSGESWRFDPGGGPAYLLHVTEQDGRTGEFVAVLFRVRGRTFLDLQSACTDTTWSESCRLLNIRAHTLVHVRQVEPTLQVSFPDPDWLKRRLEQNRLAIRHEIVDEMVVLTAPARDLQDFFLGHLGTKGAYSEPDTLTRRP